MLKFVKEVLSEKGQPSSKRVFGGMSYITVIGCVVYLCIKDGGTTVVESLIQTLLITSSGLLGISSVTSMFGKKDEE